MQWFRFEWDEGYAMSEKLYMELLVDVKNRREAGTAKECMTTRGLQDQESLGISDLQLAFAMAAPFGAGTDTVSGQQLFKTGL